MTPEARLAAAAEILDRYLAGEPAEKVLTNWARRSRFAGSKDRAAIRDHVFDAVRRRRSAAALGGAETGRGLVIGLLRAQRLDPATLLTGQGHALPAPTPAELAHAATLQGNARIDCPDWLEPELRRSLGPDFDPVMARMQARAGLFLRVNAARSTPEAALSRLAEDGVTAEPHALCATALAVTDGARALRTSRAYRDGSVEIQDVASQTVAAAVPLPASGRILDLCAGGGGKALALAARGGGPIDVHDADPGRMKDLPERAQRAGADLVAVAPQGLAARAPYALVVADVPCTGSGAWRRQPEAKWTLRQADLDDLVVRQREILAQAASLTAPAGTIAYMTCSLLRSENEDQVTHFLAARPEWSCGLRRRISPLEGGDGFFLAVLSRNG